MKSGKSESSSQNKHLIKQRSHDDKLEEIFKMAFETDFSHLESGQRLLAAFEQENKDPILLQILESYMSHNDYLQLKNELNDFASQQKQEEE